MDFQLVTSYKPKGDQPRAIEQLVEGLAAGVSVHSGKAGHSKDLSQKPVDGGRMIGLPPKSIEF